MTDTEYDVVVVRGMALSPNSRPKCAMCGSQKNLGRIISPGLRYGVVLCPQDAPHWMEAVVGSIVTSPERIAEILHDAGLL